MHRKIEFQAEDAAWIAVTRHVSDLPISPSISFSGGRLLFATRNKSLHADAGRRLAAFRLRIAGRPDQTISSDRQIAAVRAPQNEVDPIAIGNEPRCELDGKSAAQTRRSIVDRMLTKTATLFPHSASH